MMTPEHGGTLTTNQCQHLAIKKNSDELKKISVSMAAAAFL